MEKQRSTYAVANWKMNPQTPAEAKKIFTGIRAAARKAKKARTVICAPFVFLESLSRLADDAAMLGAQDVFWESHGSYTGEVSPDQLREVGATHVIIGHSERRGMGESDEDVNKKMLSALKADLSAILCVGEKIRDDEGEYLEFLKQEIEAALSKVQKRHLKNIIIAYEPIWAIGKSEKEAMTGRELHETSIYIRKVLTDLYSAAEASKVSILYGGSVSPANAQEIVKEGHVEGLLVGRQSLLPPAFGDIIKIIDEL